MGLSKALKEELKAEIILKLKKKISGYDFSKKSGNPFIDIIFDKFSNIKSFIHGTATMLGSEYEIMARKIAKSNPEFVEGKKIVLEGKISDKEKAVIKDIVKDLEEEKAGSDYNAEIKKIFEANDDNLKETHITIDLYLKTKKGKEVFIEMKGPDPNKKEVRAAKEDLLNVVAMKKRGVSEEKFSEKVGIIFGVYYNNHEEEYDNWKVSPIFEEGKGLLIQETFWDFLGGKGTFNAILEMIQEIKLEVYPLIKTKIEKL
jgi:type II restriction enzyme